jgi:hypothetical protein
MQVQLSRLLQLPEDVLLDVVQRVGSRERQAFCTTCQTLRELTLPGCLVTVVKPTEAAVRRTPFTPAARPKAVRIEGVTLSGLLSSSGWLSGIQKLELVRVSMQ